MCSTYAPHLLHEDQSDRYTPVSSSGSTDNQLTRFKLEAVLLRGGVISLDTLIEGYDQSHQKTDPSQDTKSAWLVPNPRGGRMSDRH